MKYTLPVAIALLLLCVSRFDVLAAQLLCSGVLGNSGEQGSTLVHFGSVPTHGMGVVDDDNGSLWDRGGEGVLNRYARDGRLLASYKIPFGHGDADRMTRVGNEILLLLAGKLYALPLDSPSGASAAPLGISADMMSFGSTNGSIAIAATQDRRGWNLSLFNPASGKSAPLLDGTLGGVRQIEITPDGGLIVQVAGKLHLFQNGRETTTGWPTTAPQGMLQFIDGYWYASMVHGTVRRFNAAMEADPGVVAGGAAEHLSAMWMGMRSSATA